MDSDLIKDLLKAYPCFKGVYPKDLLPGKIQKNFSCIANTHSSDKPGEHWVCIIIENGMGEYFDSFGLPPLHEEMLNFLNRNCVKGWRYNPITLQSVTDITCGHYCVLYVMFRCQGYTYRNYLSEFYKNTKLNDLKMHSLFGKLRKWIN